MKKTALLIALVACAFLLIKCNNPKTQTAPANPWACTSTTLDSLAEADINPDSVDFSFVFMGCNRVADTGAALTNATTANVFQLQRTFNEVAAMKIKPKFFFFLGDLVLGLDTTKDYLSTQLKAWVQQFQSDTFSAMPNSGIRLVAVPGNHEMLYKVKSSKSNSEKESSKKNKKEEQPWASAPAVWRSIMQSFSIQPPDDYGISYNTNDSLTYSFNYKNTHFVLVNTDTYYATQADTPGLVPATWIVNDITAARAQNPNQHIFVMGHKPAQIIYDSILTPQKASKKDDIIKLDSATVIWTAMQNNKVEAMLTAHRHEFLVTQPTPGQTTQIIAGNGGSLYESALPINNQFFGYTKVYVMKNGHVHARSFGRLTPGSKTTNTYVDPLP
ncbi:MAG TPA: metallophosphoesterase, partial [Bacteroidia bacterium]|nr:metallophosphoesterase [Bacteroidia bacterium]